MEIKNNERITLTGHFTLGERVADNQKKTISEALSLKCSLGIVVNDINFARKLSYYGVFGLEAVANLGRPVCGSSRRCYSTKELEESSYSLALDLLSRKGLTDKKSIAFTNPDYLLAVREEVIPFLIARRIEQYGLELDSIRVYRENYLRNTASMRLKNKRLRSKLSWIPKILPFIREIELEKGFITSQGIPKCKAIMLALYEKLSLEGYREINQLYEKVDQDAVEESTNLCLNLHKKFPEDSRWNLTFNNQYY